MSKPEFDGVQVGDRIRATFDKHPPGRSIIVEFTVGNISRGLYGYELRADTGVFSIWASGWDVEILEREEKQNEQT